MSAPSSGLTPASDARRELAILRALGASPGQVFALLAVESALLTLAAAGGLRQAGLPPFFGLRYRLTSAVWYRSCAARAATAANGTSTKSTGRRYLTPAHDTMWIEV